MVWMSKGFASRSVRRLRYALRRAAEIRGDAFVFLMAARFMPLKAHDTAIRALAILAKETGGENGHLLLVGAGDSGLIAGLKTLAVGLGVSGRISFCGVQADAVPFYHAADAYTLTSRSEVFPLSALEALSTGLPCVLTDVGGAGEIIRTARTVTWSRRTRRLTSPKAGCGC